MSGFFIDRPVFAWVLVLMVMLAGGISLVSLPVAQYPTVAPPAVQITADYPGADAATVQDTVTRVIEQNMNGLDGLMYMSATSDATGSATLTLTFETGTDPDIAQVQVQNRLQAAMSRLPAVVQSQGVNVRKASTGFLLVAGFTAAPGSSLKQGDLADYVASDIEDPVSRLSGVGQLQLFGAQYAMRVWLNPEKLNGLSLTPQDVVNAIRSRNDQVAGGQLGGLPASPDQRLNASIIAQTRLSTPEQFADILIRVNADGSQVRLRDVARVELGSESYTTSAQYNGRPAAGLGIKLAPGANALDTAKAVKATINGMSGDFPDGMQVVWPYDTTPFITLSVQEVFQTLAEAILLVFMVMYLFMQSLRATLIPTIAVPVVLLGTFAVLQVAGFSLNTLTLFALVLAIGLLVDDAIVVVENVERVMEEEGLCPKEATRQSMRRIQGALAGITLVLSAVFVPMAFFGGSAGAIYRQFSVTIVAAMVLSVLVAMVLTPALCATLLRPRERHGDSSRGPARLFDRFNRLFEKSTERYTQRTATLLTRTGRMMALYLFLILVMGGMFALLPAAFLPDEDQGVFMNLVQLPSGATQARTQATLDAVTRYYLHDEAGTVNSVFTVAGFGFNGNGQNTGIAFVSLKDWSHRLKEAQHAEAIIMRANRAFARNIHDGVAFAFNLPAITELGTATGFDVQLIDRHNQGHAALTRARNQLLFMTRKFPGIVTKVRPNGLEDAPQFRLEVDQARAEALGVSNDDVNATLSTALGSTRVNDFTDRGRVKGVYVQSDVPGRMLPEDIDRWFVRGSGGQMVPFSAFSRARWTSGSPRLERYNGQPSMEILGEPAPGRSTGQAMMLLEKLAQRLPPGFTLAWTGMSYQEQLSGHQAPALYALSLLVVFLCLAALCESWSVPLAVMLVVPLGVVGALAAAMARGLSNDVYFQVGLLTTIGLSAKNAILIVEFALAELKDGKGVTDAILTAARQRLRPILMTSLAFILGVLPLVVSDGAGSGARHAVGTGVMGGMISATLLTLYLVPVFFVVVMRRFARGEG
ncbi:efflux RND transporter permease subunit [Enterobacter cloacae]|nr:efflux RND transporter permease subunit [Enterobacter cloacae]